MRAFNAEIDMGGATIPQDKTECHPLEKWASIWIPGKYLHHFWEFGLNPVWIPGAETSHRCCLDGDGFSLDSENNYMTFV